MNKALEALKEIEWMQVDEQMDERCPVCERSRTQQHAQWCRLDRAIGFLERQPKCKTCGGVRRYKMQAGPEGRIECDIPCPDCAESS